MYISVRDIPHIYEQGGYLTETLTPEALRIQVEEAIQEWASEEPTQLVLVEPGQGENAQRLVDYFGLIRVLNNDEILPYELHHRLWEWEIHRQAAKKGLVPVTKLLPVHVLTPQEAKIVTALARGSYRTPEGDPLGVIVETWESVPPPEEWVKEGGVILDKLALEGFGLEAVSFHRFVPKEEITLEHVPYIELFFDIDSIEWSEIEATEQLKLAADMLEG